MPTQRELAEAFGDEVNPELEDAEVQQQSEDDLQRKLAIAFGDLEEEQLPEPTVTKEGMIVDEDVMVRQNPDLGLGRKSRILVGEGLEAAAETLEFLPKTIGGAIDEASAMLGITQPGQFPIRDTIDSIIRFDETARMIVPTESRIPETPTEHGLAAFARGGGSAVPVVGPMLSVGGGRLTQGTASELSAAQQANIASGKTLTTPGAASARTTASGTEGLKQTTDVGLSGLAAARPGVTLATEGGIAAGGGTGAFLGAKSMEDGTPEQMKEAAEFGEIAGTITGALSPVALAVISDLGRNNIVSRWIMDKTKPARELASTVFDRQAYQEAGFWKKVNPKNWKTFLNDDALEKFGRRDVLKHLDNLIPTKAIEEKVQDRVRIIKELQKIDPEFNPSLGSIIGTPESQAFQQVVDFQNPELALEMLDKNQKALKNIRNQIAKDPTAKFSTELGDMFEMISKDTEILLDNMSTRMDDTAARIMDDMFVNAGDPTEEGQMLRAHMDNMQAVYKKVVDDMFARIEVPDKIKFKVDKLDAFVTEINQAANPDSIVGSGVRTLERILPAALKESGEVGKRTMDYKTLNRFRSRLGQELADLRSTNPHSPFIKTIEDVRNGIDQIIDEGIDSLPESMQHIKQAREDAKNFFKEEFVPRFRQGTLADMQTRNPDGTMRLTDDSIMAKFWQQGDKTSGSQDFKKLFQNFHNPDSGQFDTKGLQLLGDEAKAAQKSLERYAINTLRVDMMNSAKAGTDPNKVLDAWRKKYRGALEQFPDIAKKTETMEEAFGTIAEQHKQFTEQRNFLSKNLISKYMHTDPDKVVNEFMSSPRQAKRILDNIQSVYGHQPEKVEAIRDAIEVATVNRIIEASTKGGEFDYKSIARIMENGNETLPLLMGADNYNKLIAFNKGLGILDDQPQLLAKAELNKLKELLDQAGVSPASILSRYYSAALGKVGGPYLIADASTRFLTKRAEVYFKNLYKELMYDPNTLENLENLLTKNLVEFERTGKMPQQMSPRMALMLSGLGLRLNDDLQDDDNAPKEIYESIDDLPPIEITRGILPDQEPLLEEPVTRTITIDPNTGEIQ